MMQYLGAVLLLALSTAAGAQQQPAASASAATPDKSNADKKVCVQQIPTGSSMARRVCHTKAEWKAIHTGDDQAADSFRQARQAGSGQFSQ